VKKKKKSRNNRVLLLGPGGEHLNYRQKVRNDLIKNFNYKHEDIVIMEDIDDQKFNTIDKKFDYILRKYNPKAIIAFFRNNAYMGGVIFEIGYICGKYGPNNIGYRLRFAFQKGYDIHHMTRYVKNLFNRGQGQIAVIDDDDMYFHADIAINNFIQNIP
jgi:hypothetical protein